MDSRKPAPIGVGVISVVTVLLVLTLTLFAALTLASARADLALSRRNADTVQAYYRADREAVEQYEQFAAGDGEELTARLPVTQGQNLELHLRREPDGSVAILSWRTAPAEDGAEMEEFLPVWDGEVPD